MDPGIAEWDFLTNSSLEGLVTPPFVGEGEPAELKHLSKRRKRKQYAMP